MRTAARCPAEAHRHAREVGRDERRALRAGDPQRGVERRLRERLADEREEDAPAADAGRRRAPRPADPRRRQARDATRPRPAARPGRSRQDRHRWSRLPVPSRARSATIRTSTPGSASSEPHRQAARAGARARPRRRRRRRSGRRCSRARAPRAGPPSTTSSPASTSRCAPSTRREPAQRVELLGSSSVGGSCPRSRDVEQVELGAEPLRRAPRAAHDPLGARLRRDEGEQPLADGLRRGASTQPVLARRRHAGALAHEPLGLDLLGDLAQRDLAQRREVLHLEEAVERGRHPRPADRPCRPAGARSAPRA